MPRKLEQLQGLINHNQAILLSNLSDIKYFSGFEYLVPSEREALALIGRDFAYLIHASFSPKPVNHLFTFLPGLSIKLSDHLKEIKQKHGFEEIMIDEESLFVSELRVLQKSNDWQIKPFSRDVIWELRQVKTNHELEKITAACAIAKQAYEEIKVKIKPGISEKRLSLLLEERMRQLGSTRPAFPTIVAFAENTALPHHQPSQKELEKEMAILLDFGATVDGYCSDMTRSFWFGSQQPSKYSQIKEAVETAYQRVLDQLNMIPFHAETKNVVVAQHLDNLARTHITAAGFGDQFIHTTGHGVGLDIHEPPSISWKNQQPIVPGMVITVEPGIYLEQEFGYRYENTIYVPFQEKCLELTK
ncbi:MAG: M24 family metallopeptidase [Patescibacteria group bacterium]